MSYKFPRPYLNGPKRPRMTPPGTRPNDKRRATKHKRPEYGLDLIAASVERFDWRLTHDKAWCERNDVVFAGAE